MRLHRTPAERRVDELVAEARGLRRQRKPSAEDRARLAKIAMIELPKAWRAVQMGRRAS